MNEDIDPRATFKTNRRHIEEEERGTVSGEVMSQGEDQMCEEV